MTKISELHRRWSKDRGYKGAYDALGEEFDLARALIEARTAAGPETAPRQLENVCPTRTVATAVFLARELAPFGRVPGTRWRSR
jgi:hypothetical protein